MNNKFTEHARKRMQQRAISQLQVKLIETFGREIDQKGGSSFSFIPADDIRALRAAIDKIEGVRLVSGAAGRVVTVMHETRRLRGA